MSQTRSLCSPTTVNTLDDRSHLYRCLISSKRYVGQAESFPGGRPMRKSSAETATAREHILEVAAEQFMAHGINDAGLARVMKAAGLTHGGFYRHVSSKDELVAEACRRAFSSLPADLDSEGDLTKIVGEYLSRNHRDNPRT